MKKEKVKNIPGGGYKYLIILFLLVSVIGISFAYFTASTTRNNLTTSALDTTVTIDNTKFIIEGKLAINDLNILPGHKSVSSIKVTARGDHTINYNLIWDGINSLERLDYKVYKTTEEIVPTTTCRRITEKETGLTKYYEECNITNITELGKVISSGSINKNTEITEEVLKSNESITATKEGTSVYYYVVLEFPNLDKDQNIDMNSKFEGEITVESSEIDFNKNDDVKGDLNILAMYIQENDEYKEVDVMPDTGYEINVSKSYCNVNGEKDPNVSIENYKGKLLLSKLQKGSNCYIYFDEIAFRVKNILEKYTISTSRSGTLRTTFKSSTPTTVYSKADDNGTSYAFAGVNPNNWVKLGNMYFRIIRFNGDGSLRLIYSGEGSPATTGTGTRTGTSEFNTSYDNNMYVGLQYTNGQVHGTIKNSKILGENDSTDAKTLYGWYNNKIKPNYEKLIDTNAGFCSDREPSTDSSTSNASGGTGTTETYYGAFIRYKKGDTWQSTYTPTLTCKNASDNLKLSVGLITVDEYMLAGGGNLKSSTYYNTSFWLHVGLSYWTMTPSDFTNNTAYTFAVWELGYNIISPLIGISSIRPVINLKASTSFEDNDADGTAENPFIVIY